MNRKQLDDLMRDYIARGKQIKQLSKPTVEILHEQWKDRTPIHLKAKWDAKKNSSTPQKPQDSEETA